MRAYNITTITRRRRHARRRRAVALALGICALAIPASASADPLGADGSPLNTLDPPASEQNGSGGSPYEGGTDYATPNAILGADGLGEPTGVTGSPADPADGFDWVSAAVGAGAAMALLALGGAALLTVRRHTTMSPSAGAS